MKSLTEKVLIVIRNIMVAVFAVIFLVSFVVTFEVTTEKQISLETNILNNSEETSITDMIGAITSPTGTIINALSDEILLKTSENNDLGFFDGAKNGFLILPLYIKDIFLSSYIEAVMKDSIFTFFIGLIKYTFAGFFSMIVLWFKILTQKADILYYVGYFLSIASLSAYSWVNDALEDIPSSSKDKEETSSSSEDKMETGSET